MGDANTHVIFYQAYWFLVRKEGDEWVDQFLNPVCKIGQKEKNMKLDDIK